MRKPQLVILAIFIAVFTVLAGVNSHKAFALAYGDVDAWQTSDNTLPDTVRAAGSTVYNSRAYVAGGDNLSGPTNTVYFTQLNNDGIAGSWQSTTVLPDSFMEPTVTAYDGYLYVMGGYNGSVRNTVYYAPINTDGSVGSWTASTNTLPHGAHAGTGFAHNGYLYYMGGVNFGTTYNTVSFAPINGDGTIGTWTNSTSMPDNRRRASTFVANNRVYVLGGQDISNTFQSTVMYADLNTDGTVGTWSVSSKTLPEARLSGGAAYANGYGYYIAGNNGSSPTSTVFHAKINSDGTTGDWTTATNSLPQARDALMSVVNNGYLFVMGGANSSGDKVNTVYSARVVPYNANADDDSDGVTNGVEDGAPHGGDANSDGILDSAQSSVASFVNSATGHYVTLMMENDGPVCDITSAGISPESDNSAQDTGYKYSLGMVNFTATCPSNGFGIGVETLYFDESYNENFVLRKYNPNTHEYFNVGEDNYPTIYQNTSDDDHNVVSAIYFMNEGGELDADGLANGTIVDPVGLAVVDTQDNNTSNNSTSNANGSLANTGSNYLFYLFMSVGILVSGIGTTILARRRD